MNGNQLNPHTLSYKVTAETPDTTYGMIYNISKSLALIKGKKDKEMAIESLKALVDRMTLELKEETTNGSVL